MNDRNIDIELIMALVEGSLPADEAATAEASLDGAARTELNVQRAMRAGLADLGTAAMSATERSDLHRALKDELNLADPQTPSGPARGRARPPWHARALPALGALAALVVVVGIGINNIGIGESDSETTVELSAESIGDTNVTVAATTAATNSALSGASADRATTEATTAAASATTDAMAELAAPTVTANDDVFRIMMLPHDLGDISLANEAGIVAAIDQAAIEIAEYTPYPAFSLNRTAAEPGLLCWTFVIANVSPDTEVDYLGIAVIDGEPGEVYRTLEANGQGVIYLILVDACEPVGVIPR